MTDMVQVPRELLREVLDEAAADAQTVEHEFGVHAKDQAAYDEHRARIAELRKAAGLDNELEPSTGWRWWSRDEPEDGLLGFETVEDRDAFSRGDEGPFRRVISDDGRTIRQGETWREMMDRMSKAAGLEVEDV